MNGAGGIGDGGPSRFGDIVDALRDGRIKGDEARLRSATDAMEGAFYQELFKAMRETVPETGLTSGGSGEDSFTAMLDQHIAEVAASRSDGGLGEALFRWFTRGSGVEP